MPVVPVLGTWRQEDQKSKISQDYIRQERKERREERGREERGEGREEGGEGKEGRKEKGREPGKPFHLILEDDHQSLGCIRVCRGVNLWLELFC